MSQIPASNRSLGIVLIAPFPPPHVGTTVSALQLANFLEQQSGVALHRLDTAGVRGKGLRGIMRFLGLLCRAFSAARKADVVTLHCSTTAVHLVGLPVYLVARVARRPFILRKFAGDDHRDRLGRISALVAEWVLRRADRYLAQTKHLVALAEERGFTQCTWFPTSRPAPPESFAPRAPGGPCRKYVYVGRICEVKGMHTLVAAAKSLPPDVSVDLYGPWYDATERTVFDGSPNLHYRGELRPEEVLSTMAQYDASLLPTHYMGEGYPGAVIESYIAGLPVIASDWQAIPEIVDDSVGLLVPPRDPEALANALTRLSEDQSLYNKLQSNTRDKALFFSSEHWASYFVELCEDIARKNWKR